MKQTRLDHLRETLRWNTAFVFAYRRPPSQMKRRIAEVNALRFTYRRVCLSSARR